MYVYKGETILYNICQALENFTKQKIDQHINGNFTSGLPPHAAAVRRADHVIQRVAVLETEQGRAIVIRNRAMALFCRKTGNTALLNIIKNTHVSLFFTVTEPLERVSLKHLLCNIR